jgi:hypothetical protein
MHRFTGYALLAIVALAAPIGGQTKAPSAVVREIAKLAGVSAGSAARLPGGRIIIYSEGDRIVAYLSRTTSRRNAAPQLRLGSAASSA